MITIRACSGFEELEACVRLQIETWGYHEADVIPRRAFLVAQNIGGQVIGAFDSELGAEGSDGAAKSLIGFALSLPGVNTVERVPQPYLHSHMLAVKEGYRDRGIGSQLKWEQRREALARGIRRMEWTFDPLEIKNAYLNIHRLGAIVSSYRVDFYGVSSSRLQGGLPTDRLLAEWRLDSPRVEGILAGRPAVEYKVEERIAVPGCIYRWKASERDRAVGLQLENRQKFQRAFSKGFAVLDFVRDSEGNGVFELGTPTQAELN